MRLWWWRDVRKANIPKKWRDIFERFGEIVIGNILSGGLNPRSTELQKIYTNEEGSLKHAADWLTECGDKREQRDQRSETVEWAILIFVVFGVVIDFIQLAREFHWF
jgi:hypothetical protein